MLRSPVIVPPSDHDRYEGYLRKINDALEADNRRLRRERAKLRSTLRSAISIIERQGGYAVGDDVKALAKRGGR